MKAEKHLDPSWKLSAISKENNMNRHTHYKTDSVSVCQDCDINLRLVNALSKNGIFKWGQVRTARKGTDLIFMQGVGERSQIRLNKMRILGK